MFKAKLRVTVTRTIERTWEGKDLNDCVNQAEREAKAEHGPVDACRVLVLETCKDKGELLP